MKLKKVLAIGLVGVISVVSLAGCFEKKAPLPPANLNVYGLDDSDVMTPIITEYRKINSSVSIKYKKFSDPAEYENLVINEIAEGEGPDVFYIHNTWLPKHVKKLLPLDSDTLSQKVFGDSFVKVASDDFISPDPATGLAKIYAMPLYVDTLALYYNKKDFEQKLPEKGKPAKTWDEFLVDAEKFRRQATNGKLEHGAIAFGRADNMKLAVDALYNLILQTGAPFYDSAFMSTNFAGPAKEVFDYFLSFAVSHNKNYSWSTDLVPATSPFGELDGFLSGKVSSMLAYSDLYPRLETELKNVKSRMGSTISLADVKVAPVPQIAENEADYKVWANYYGLAVSRNTKAPAVAADFVKFATSKQSAATYHSKTKRPTARRDLIEDQKKEPITDVFVSQLGYAASYRIYSDIEFAEALKMAISDAVNGMASKDALNKAQTTINAMLKIAEPEGLYPKPKTKK
jgi:ABC-type glycerol-3-phosphate transport system substrate-binding protein